MIGAIVPWNFPLLMASWKLGPGARHRQLVVLKPSRAVAADRAAPGRAGARGRPAAGRVQRRARLRREAGAALGAAHGRRRDRRSPARREVGSYFLEYAGKSNLKRVSHELRRQVAVHRVRRLRRPRARRAAPPPAACSSTRARCCNAPLARARARLDRRRVPREGDGATAPKYAPGDPLDPKTEMGAIVDEHAAGDRARLHRGRPSEDGARSSDGRHARARRDGRLLRRADGVRRRRPTRCASRRRRSSARCWR